MGHFIEESSPLGESVTVRHGYWFYFNNEGQNIAINGEAFTGKEFVYFNRKLVSQRRSFSIKSEHKFKQLSDQYIVSIHVTNILTGKVVCELYKNGIFLNEQSKAYLGGEDRPLIKSLLGFFAGGVLFGIVGYIIGYCVAVYLR